MVFFAAAARGVRFSSSVAVGIWFVGVALWCGGHRRAGVAGRVFAAALSQKEAGLRATIYKLLREWEWAEVSASDIDPAFRALYREHVGDRYGDADGSSRGRTVAAPLFGDPNALV